MAISIRIPGLLRLVWVTAPAEIAALNEAPQVSRSVSGGGGVINRAIAARFLPFRTPDGDIWPAFRDRLDPLRIARQSELDVALADVGALLQRIRPEIAALAGYPPSRIRAPEKLGRGVRILRQAVEPLSRSRFRASPAGGGLARRREQGVDCA